MAEDLAPAMVIAGNINSARRMEYTVIDDNVDVAAVCRGLPNRARSSSLKQLITLVSGLVEARRMDPMEFKGKYRPVAVYRIDGLKIDRDGFLEQLGID
jgi:adenylate cyclase